MARPAAIIADDEALLAEQLRLKLTRHWPELDIRAIVASGRAQRDSGELRLKNYQEKLDVSRSYLHLFRQM